MKTATARTWIRDKVRWFWHGDVLHGRKIGCNWCRAGVALKFTSWFFFALAIVMPLMRLATG